MIFIRIYSIYIKIYLHVTFINLFGFTDHKLFLRNRLFILQSDLMNENGLLLTSISIYLIDSD